MSQKGNISRRDFLRAGAAASIAIPTFVNSSAFGANDRIVMGCIGMGGQGRGDMGGFMSLGVQVVAVCDVVGEHLNQAKNQVNNHNKNQDCKTYKDWRDVIARDDLDTIFVGTPDHWHAIIAIEAMKNGKDVYCEKPETLTVREGRRMADIVKQYGRVFSGGSQRVWGDYNWLHKMYRSGAIGQVNEAWVNIWGASGPCYLPEEEKPSDVDWEMWLGPAPWRPYHKSLTKGDFRPYRDYSGGGMTDWGCHSFAGTMFCMDLHYTGPTEIIPPNGKDVPQLTYKFANGFKMYHQGGFDGKNIINLRGEEGDFTDRGPRHGKKMSPPDIYIPNYKGHGGIFGDFLHCVKTRETPFRNIEVAHRAASVCHLGNIAYWLGRPIKWDPEKEEIIGDAEASRWLDRAKREPWAMS